MEIKELRSSITSSNVPTILGEPGGLTWLDESTITCRKSWSRAANLEDVLDIAEKRVLNRQSYNDRKC